MAQLGNQTIGTFFSVGGSFGQAAGGPYTVPSPGIFVDQINFYGDNNGSSATDRHYVWVNSGGQAGAWLVRAAATFSMDSGRKWRVQAGITSFNGAAGIGSDGYIPAGTVIWIGLNSSDGTLSYEGKNTGTTDIGNTQDGNFSFHDVAGGGMGQLAAYIDYHVLAAPTLSGASPAVAPAGATTTLTGTNLRHTSSITVCGVNAPTFTINSDTSITVTVPAGASGAGTIVVTTPAGTASTAFTAGQVYYGTGAAVASIAAVWYGDGGGVPHKVAGIWVPNGAGVKRVW